MTRSERFSYAYQKITAWHVGGARAWWLAARYALTGDTGRFRSHGGWYKSRLYRDDESD